ncbi:MAG TPA: choice-of-anchor D domain-containing protein [Candidatus Acidoferrales bacterium]|nr:choice-of-anchor D domain-containing protein [Candidatus Acidoferrales bacterium]
MSLNSRSKVFFRFAAFAVLALGLGCVFIVRRAPRRHVPFPQDTQHPAAARARFSFAPLKQGASPPQNLSWEFEPNVGQAAPRAKFLARANDASLFLAQDSLAIVWSSRAAKPGTQSLAPRQTALQMDFEGAQKNVRLSGERLLPGKTNYLLGNDPRKWHTNVPHYASVQYRGLYPQIDAQFYGNLHGLEYDLIVQPGGDLRNARLLFHGASALQMNRVGDVLVRVGSRQIAMHRPQVYQQDHGRRIDVAGGYKLLSRDEIGFTVGKYRADLPLVVDPQISIAYTTFLGGNGADKANSVAVDSSGNVYVGGTTTNITTFPESTTCNDVTSTTCGGASSGATSNLFVAKINPNPSGGASGLVYLTFIGGSGNDQGGMIALDNSPGASNPPNLAILGWTTSANFPVTVTSGNPGSSLDGSSDMTVTDLNGAGSGLNYSEYYGGSGAEAAQGYAGIATDSTGDVFITSDTSSTDLLTAIPPITTGFQSTYGGGASDGFLAEFTASTGTLAYATYFGIDATVASTSIALDSSGHAYIAGFTSLPATNFPATNRFSGGPGGGSSDAFVMQINPASGGGIVYASTFGGSGADQALAIAVDTSSPPDAYITGVTQSADFIVSGLPDSPFQSSLNGTSNAFLAVVSQTSATPTVTSLQYETYLGGTGSDSGQGIAVVSPPVVSAPQVYVVGKTTSNNFPVLCSLQSFTGSQDAFLAELNPTVSGASSLIYNSFLAGSASTEANAVATDSAGDAVVAGDTTSNDYPLVTGAPQTGIQPTCTSCALTPAESDTFLTTVTLPSGPPACGAYAPSVGAIGSFAEGTSSPPLNVQFTNDGSAGSTLNITGFTVSGTNASDFVASGPSTGTSCLANPPLAQGARCDFQVVFTPSTVGPETAEVQITDDGVGSPQVLDLTGTGTSVEVNLAPNSLVFPSTPQGLTSPAPQNPVLMNVGSNNFTLTTVQLLGTNASDFAFTTGNTCTTGLQLTPGSPCTIAVNFAPNEPNPPQTLSAQVSILLTDTTNATETVTVSLSGTEVAATPEAIPSPASLTFTNENIGVASGSQPVTLTNNGNVALSISSISLAGLNPGDFSLLPAGNCPISPSTLTSTSPNNSCTINATFKPTATGLRSASITVTDNASTSPQSIPLSGTGTSPGVNFSLPNLTFGPQDVSTSSTPPQTVMLSNTGSGPLTISSIGFTGTNPGDFSQTNNCPSSSSTLNQNSSCTISVTFTPTATGSRSALLTVTDDATTSPQTLPVSGTGAQPTALFVPNGLQFPTTVVGIKVAGVPVQVQNTGNGPLVISNIAFTGTDPGDFSAAGTCVPAGSNVTVAAGGNCSLNLSFLPTSSGTRTASLVLTDNAPNSPQADALNGSAQDYQLQPISGGSTSATVAAGSSATISMQVTPFNGFTGTVNLLCSDSITGSACSITPSVTVSGNSAAPFTVNLTTTAAKSFAPFSGPFGSRPLRRTPVPLWTVWLLALAMLAFLMKTKARRRYLRPLLVLSLLALSSCGGGNSNNTTQGTATPPGTYTVVVTGTITGTSRSVNLTLTVTP